MSTQARVEAISVLSVELSDVEMARIVAAVDKLLETHSISRNAPRVHRPSDDNHPRAQVARMMAGGE